MVDFLFSQLPEEPEASAAEQYAKTPSTLGEAARAISSMQPTGKLVTGTAGTREQYESQLFPSAEEAAHDPGAVLYRSFLAGIEPSAGLTPQSLYEPSPMIEPSETAKYSADGKPLSDKPIPEKLAQDLGRHQFEKAEAEGAVDRFNKSHSWTTNVGLDLAVGMTDVLNISTMFIPALGEEAIAARLGLTGFLGRSLARGIAGLAAGPAMQAPISALELAVDPDYSMRQALYDTAFQAPLAAAIGSTAIGLPGEALRWMRGTPATVTHAGMSVATADIVQGKPVDVGFIPVPEEVSAPVRSWAASQGRALRMPEEPIEGLEFLPPTIENAFPLFAERQKALAETGYAPGMPEGRLARAEAEIAAIPAPEKPAAEIEPAPAGWATPIERTEVPQAEPGGMPAEREQAMASLFTERPDLERAERDLAAIDQASLLPVEREALTTTADELREAVDKEEAYKEAANCLAESGL